MESLSFKRMEAVYQLEAEFRKKKNKDYVSAYSCRWLLHANYNTSTEAYEFLLNRKDIKINHKEIEKLMDKVIYKIGSALYPIRLQVSNQLEITGIINYAEAAGRWKETAGQCRQEYPGEVMDVYIRNAESNVCTPQALQLSIYRDSFINLYFRNVYTLPEHPQERERIEWYNFPEWERNTTYFCTIEEPRTNTRKLRGELISILPDGPGGTAMVEYTYGVKGELKEVDGLFTVYSDQREYEKKIRISPVSIQLD